MKVKKIREYEKCANLFFVPKLMFDVFCTHLLLPKDDVDCAFSHENSPSHATRPIICHSFYPLFFSIFFFLPLCIIASSKARAAKKRFTHDSVYSGAVGTPFSCLAESWKEKGGEGWSLPLQFTNSVVLASEGREQAT